MSNAHFRPDCYSVLLGLVRNLFTKSKVVSQLHPVQSKHTTCSSLPVNGFRSSLIITAMPHICILLNWHIYVILYFIKKINHYFRLIFYISISKFFKKLLFIFICNVVQYFPSALFLRPRNWVTQFISSRSGTRRIFIGK